MGIYRPDTFDSIGDATVLGGSGGATSFVGLTDTPSNYTGAAGQFAQVNSGATGMEFGIPSGTRVGGVVVDGSVVQSTVLLGGVDTVIPNVSMTWDVTDATQIVCVHTTVETASANTNVTFKLSSAAGEAIPLISGTTRFLGTIPNNTIMNYMFMWQLTGLTPGASQTAQLVINMSNDGVSHVGTPYMGTFMYAMHP